MKTCFKPVLDKSPPPSGFVLCLNKEKLGLLLVLGVCGSRFVFLGNSSVRDHCAWQTIMGLNGH